MTITNQVTKWKPNPGGFLAETDLESHSWRMRKVIDDEHFEDKLTYYPLTVCELNPRLLINILCSIYSDRQLIMSSLSPTTLSKAGPAQYPGQRTTMGKLKTNKLLFLIIYIHMLIIWG